MIDLFGLGKSRDRDPEEPQEPSTPPAPSAGQHRLWAVLLVLDSLFVIVFGGATAAKVYQYWKSPSVSVSSAQRRHPGKKEAPKPAETPKAAEPLASTATAAAARPEPSRPPEPARAPEPARTPEPKAAAHRADGMRPPKPSLVTEPPKPHQTPKLAGAEGAAPQETAKAPAAPPPAKPRTGKARPVEFKILAPKAGSVQLVGAFIVHGGHKEMTRQDDGTWTVTLYLHPGQYRYFFSVDHRKVLDPDNSQSARGASLLDVP